MREYKVFTLNKILNNKFEQLKKHMQVSDYVMSERNYDTITICNRIFQKLSE